MSNKIEYWSDATTEIAQLLFDFSEEILKTNEIKDLPEALFHKLNQDLFQRDNPWFAKGIKKYENNTLDPIQVLALFNHSASNDERRLKRIKTILNLLDNTKSINDRPNFFEGCPTVMMSRVINTRLLDYQIEIWSFFRDIMKAENFGLNELHFHQYQNWYGIDLASLTIFLFWIKPEKYVPLDKNSRQYIKNEFNINSTFRAYSDYIQVCKELEPEKIPDIVKKAGEIYGNSSRKKSIQRSVDFDQTRKEAEIEYRETATPITQELSSDKLPHPFRILALKSTKKNQKHGKNVKEELFHFYHNYQFLEEDGSEILYKENLINKIYKIDEFVKDNNQPISISAIVGQNGSGKSTLTELLFLVINRLSVLKNKEINLKNEEVFVDLYFFTDTLYKLSLGDKNTLHHYDFADETSIFTLDSENRIKDFDLSQFFYSVVVNYSLYGLNSNTVGDWIKPLFHKNDSYQTPIVLNPKRTKGNIDVNVEESLTKSRLLAFVLDWDRLNIKDDEIGDSEETRTIPLLVEDKRPNIIRVQFNEKKLENYQKHYNKRIENPLLFKTESWDVIAHIYNIKISAKKYVEETKEYIIFKLISIAETYKDEYGMFLIQGEKGVMFDNLSTYLKQLAKDESHITYKLWQALNYLRYNQFEFEDTEAILSIYETSENLNHFVKLAFEDKGKSSIIPLAKNITLLPPAILTCDLIFESGELLDDMSSGEKQYIFSLNTIAYHINNINSVGLVENRPSYSYVNLIFDEVELYFHPDMQRKYIKGLLEYIARSPLENIIGLNLIFVTHSPFILSDIPSQNILKVKKGTQSPKDDNLTFAANIHDLLANKFFMEEAFMGEYARSKIEDLILYLTDEIYHFDWTDEIAKDLIANIGEPYLKHDLQDLYNEKVFKNVSDIDLQIKQLTELKKQKLKGE